MRLPGWSLLVGLVLLGPGDGLAGNATPSASGGDAPPGRCALGALPPAPALAEEGPSESVAGRAVLPASLDAPPPAAEPAASVDPPPLPTLPEPAALTDTVVPRSEAPPLPSVQEAVTVPAVPLMTAPLTAPPEQMAPLPEPLVPVPEGLAPAPTPLDTLESLQADPMFGQILAEGPDGGCPGCKDCHPFYQLLHMFAYPPYHQKSGDVGIGQERVMYAPFTVEYAQPMSNWRFRYESIDGIKYPDMDEYWWAAPGRGPKFGEKKLDIQDLRLRQETAIGNDFSLFTEFPIRMINPQINDDTVGFGNMNIGNKAVLLRGEKWLLTQYFQAIFPTGSPHHGTGNGHTALEPGILWRYKYSPWTYIQGDVRYWIPVGGNPLYQGEMLQWGFAVSSVWYESDTFAILPALELVNYSFLRGARTEYFAPPGLTGPIPPQALIPVRTRVDETFVTVQPGVRFVLGPRGDLGLFELGTNVVISADPDEFYNNSVRVDLRWSY